MKPSVSALLVFFSSLAAFAYGQVYPVKPGQTVVEKYQGRSIQKVVQVAADNQVQLEDGQWYHPRYILPIVPSYRNVSTGQLVTETKGERELKTVRVIAADGTFLLDDGQWYESEFIEELGPPEYMNVQVGDEVVESHFERSIQKVVAIRVQNQRWQYQLEDGVWYDQKFISGLTNTYMNISVGDEVLENFGEPSVQRVIRIARDATFQLEDGQWYMYRYVRKK